jgi:hypothetical protein
VKLKQGFVACGDDVAHHMLGLSPKATTPSEAMEKANTNILSRKTRISSDPQKYLITIKYR